MSTVLILNQAQMGHGEQALGQKVLGTFLRKSVAMRDLAAIVFYNQGVHLVASDSPVLNELALLEGQGVDLLPCGTCLDHYGVTPAVAHASDMDTIVRELDRATKVITL